jgi:hypothetical protein
MAVKRNQMAQALARPQTVQRQALTVPNINTALASPFGDNSNSLQQEAYGQALINKAISGQGFDPRGGIGVAVAQIATAGIGAWAQNRARKDMAEKEVGRQQQLSSLLTSNGHTPESANAIASMTTPESGASIISAFINQDMARNDPATQLKLQQSQVDLQKSELGLTTEKLQQNKLIAETGKIRKETSNVGAIDPEKTFNNSTALRKDYLNDSKNFKIAKDGYERVITSGKNPSAAGDISLIFGYMRTLDPTSTVREGEFANAESARGISESIRAKYNKVIRGERLAPEQRADFIDRATKLYVQAEKSQNKVATQYRKIALRNRLNPEDVVVDFSTSIERGGQSVMSQQTAQKNAFKILNIRDK